MTELKKKEKLKPKAGSNDMKVTTNKTDKGVSREDLKGSMNDDLLQKLTLLDKELTEKAVSALFQYHQSTIDPKKSILGVDVPIHVQFTLERCIGVDHVKPIPVRIPYPLHKVHNGGFYNNKEDNIDNTNDMDIVNDMDDPEVCLIVKDENTKTMIQELIIEFPQYMKCVQKVLTLESLRRKYKELKQKQLLCNSYTVFMSDDRIIPMLKNELGKTFLRYNKHKIPIPVSITRKSTIPFAIYKSLSSTFFTMSVGGNCISIRAGTTAMSSENVVANILSITKYAIPKMPRKWSNIRAIGIQLPNSTLLPIYNKTPEQLLEIASLAGLKPNFKNKKNDNGTGDDNDEDKLKEKKRKSLLLEKSKSNNPLVRALKKQKKHGEDEANENSTSEKPKVIESISTPQKKHDKDDNKDSMKKKKRSLIDIDNNDIESKLDVPSSKTKDDIAQVDKKEILSSSKKQKKNKIEDKSNNNDTDIASTPRRNTNMLTTKTPPNTKSTPTSIAKNNNKDSIEEKSEKKSKKDNINVPKTDETPSTKNKKNKPSGDEEKSESKTNESGKKSNVNVATPVSNVNDKKQDETPSSKNKKMKKTLSGGEENIENKMSESGKKNKKSSSSPVVEQDLTNNKTDTPDKKKKAPASFIPSNKFTGSKPGYAFKKGQNGVGYYVDKQPIVDQMAVDALLRSVSNKTSGNRRHSGGGGRGGGRGGGSGRKQQNNNNRRKSR